MREETCPSTGPCARNVCDHLRVLVKRILCKNGSLPDKQEQATRTVLEQAEALSRKWMVA